MIDTRKQAILATRYFGVIELAVSDDAYGGVAAVNQAAAKLITEMAE